MIDFPVTPEALGTVAGIAILGALITQWLKQGLKQAMLINLVTLGLCEILSVLAGLIVVAFQPTARDLFNSLLIGFSGATLAVFGYELVKNTIELVHPSLEPSP